jgi:hypothetical protein
MLPSTLVAAPVLLPPPPAMTDGLMAYWPPCCCIDAVGVKPMIRAAMTNNPMTHPAGRRCDIDEDFIFTLSFVIGTRLLV